MATLTAGRTAAIGRAPLGPLARTGRALWRLFTSVDFAVVQIIYLATLATIGMTLRQLPDSAFRSATDYADAMAGLHAIYDPVIGAAAVDLLEQLGLFAVFRSPWFSWGLVVLVVSIVVCTLDRTPRLWRQAAEVRVAQPDPFYDPRLPDRAVTSGLSAEAVRSILRRHRFGVRAVTADGRTYLYGDRHRWTKLATLLTHLGLILFLAAAAVTSLFGDEAGLIVPEGESLTVQPVGTPDLLLVKNHGFEAPGFETGDPTDFTTDLSVYQGGVEIARKTIRVNDPLSIAGYTFHQNGFGPAPEVVIRDRADGSLLWSGPVPMVDTAAGSPYTTMTVPGRDAGLQLLLQRDASGVAIVLFLPYRVSGTDAAGEPVVEELGAVALAPGETGTTPAIDFVVGLRAVGQYTLLIAKHDPGQGIVWLAFASLITGLVVTFYLPRRRIWARIDETGRLALTVKADRYVDVEREFGRILDDVVAARQPG
jgi:cytochrome c biogenesis protein